MHRYATDLSAVKQLLKAHPHGLTIGQIAEQIKINRNSVAKYLDVLRISGQAELREVGPAKLFMHATRVPASTLLERAHELILTVDADLCIAQVNDAMLALFDKRRDEVVGERVGTSCWVEQREAIEAAIEGKESQSEFELRGRTLRAEFVPTTFDDGTRGASIIAEDVTEEKRRMERLTLYERAIESSINGIAIVDAREDDMPLIYVNTAFERITGYPKEEVIGRNCRFLQGDDRDQKVRDEIRSAIEAGREGTFVVRNYRKDGTMFMNELHLAPVKDKDGKVTHYVGVQNDVTHKHHG